MLSYAILYSTVEVQISPLLITSPVHPFERPRFFHSPFFRGCKNVNKRQCRPHCRFFVLRITPVPVAIKVIYFVGRLCYPDYWTCMHGQPIVFDRVNRLRGDSRAIFFQAKKEREYEP